MATRRRSSSQIGPQKPVGRPLVSKEGPLHATSILPEGDVRLLDAAVGLAIGGAYSIFAASRKTPTGRFFAGLAGIGVGTLALVEGRGSVLKYGGAFVAGGSGAVAVLELSGLTKTGL